MKLLPIVLSITLFTALNTDIIHTKETSHASDSSQQQDVAFIQQSLMAAASLIQQIDQTVGDLANLINKHQIPGLTSPDHILRILREDRELLIGLLQSLSSANTPEMQLQYAVILLQICDSFIPHIEHGLKHNFKEMSSFDVTTISKRKIDLNSITPQTLQAMLEAIYEKVENLKISASKAGLTWYNLAARSFDEKVVTPWNKWHGTSIVKGLGGASLISAYMIMRYGKDIKNPVIETIHNYLTQKFGVILERTAQGTLTAAGSLATPEAQTPDNSNWTLFSLIEHSLTETTSGHVPLAMFAGTALLGYYGSIWSQSISPWIEQKRTTWWNAARGGSYLNTETHSFLSNIQPKVNFDHMVGLEEVKEEFKTILEYLDDPEKFLRSGAQPETGWILTGPTRTGKSFSFECLCGEIVRMQLRKGLNPNNFRFIKFGIEEIAKYSIQGLLEFAKNNAPMVIFVDEIDLLGLQRVGDNKMLHDFLTALQSTQTDDPSKIVIVMAATNSPETLDKALRQYGRFGKEIRFEYPGFKYRKQFLMKELSAMALNPHSFDIDTIVAKTNGKSYEDLKAILRKAMTRAWALGLPLVQRLIDESIDTEINKMIMHDRKELPDHETRILASHFAGQALAMVLLDTHEQLDKVTIKAIMTEIKEVTAWYNMHQAKKDMQQKIVHGSLFTKYMHDTIELKSKEDILNDVKVLIAGFIAEEILLGSCGMQCHPEDNNKAYSVIDQFVFKGIDPNQLSKAVREKLRDEAYAMLMQCKEEVRELLEEHKEALTAITEELIEKSILSDGEIKKIIDRVEE